ncbi:MAG: hypothetical protein P1U91_08110 [Pseudophaeobacter sp. bin_em_oilr2.035]|uniref:Uncharacterized protein n=1 Tax=Phaeobacter gallaeciensis TaxID=60890 RepID=A0ABD4XD89_9RHOB|nr:hypothetical protein [Phaeobacter gallaeciensis]MDF1771904.1 hypothetical protein [Pseudophaeobacter sp. bin_em_oilr2.035]MDE4146428.1 hypothetical protein [Phaeobacter gallaeciensis]MDE4159101.1 hypothetical protein [Phaeobacter gallaeciensis]MDE4163153.1 hypothetical protein [Phaeobacter gallaeciensis]MDE4167508.1 hypothetical protein [Phaeobacter gallaeciensis]
MAFLPKETLWVKICFFLLSLIVPHLAWASEDRFARLTNSGLLERAEERGSWDVTVLPNAIEYACLVCDGEVTARLEIVAPYDAGGHSSVRQRYLAERKQFCSELAASRDGRCVSFRDFRGRGPLHWFQSVDETDAGRVIHISLFNREVGYEPELIQTTIHVGESATFPPQMTGLFRHHMARLTVWF